MKSKGNHKCAIKSDLLNLVIYFVIHLRTVAVGVTEVFLKTSSFATLSVFIKLGKHEF